MTCLLLQLVEEAVKAVVEEAVKAVAEEAVKAANMLLGSCLRCAILSKQ